jgi:hypothetical protein
LFLSQKPIVDDMDPLIEDNNEERLAESDGEDEYFDRTG